MEKSLWQKYHYFQYTYNHEENFTNYMKDIFFFAIFIYGIYNDIDIYYYIKIINYAFVNDYSIICTSKYLNNYNTSL